MLELVFILEKHKVIQILADVALGTKHVTHDGLTGTHTRKYLSVRGQSRIHQTHDH